MQVSGLAGLVPFISTSATWNNPVSLFTLRSGRWLLLVLPQLLSNHRGRWQHRLDQFWERSFTFGGQKSLMAVTFLVYWYGRSYFHFTVPPCGHKFDHIWDTYHDHFFFGPVVLIWIIPDQVKVLIDMSFCVLISGLGSLINNKIFSASYVF